MFVSLAFVAIALALDADQHQALMQAYTDLGEPLTTDKKIVLLTFRAACPAAICPRFNVTDNCVGDAVRLRCNGNAVLHLNLSDSGLTGSLTPVIGQLSRLTGLWLFKNDLTGTLITQLGLLGSLQHLFLHWNRFSSSTIPSEFGALTSLVQLDIGGLDLFGTVPVGLAVLPRLSFISLYSTRVSGSFASTSPLTECDLNLTNLNCSTVPPICPCSPRETTAQPTTSSRTIGATASGRATGLTSTAAQATTPTTVATIGSTSSGRAPRLSLFTSLSTSTAALTSSVLLDIPTLPPVSATTPTTTTAVSSTTSAPTSSAPIINLTAAPESNVAVIAGAAGGGAVALLLIGLVVFLVCRVRSRKTPATSPPATSNYGRIALTADTREYDVGNVAGPTKNEYATGNVPRIANNEYDAVGAWATPATGYDVGNVTKLH